MARFVSRPGKIQRFLSVQSLNSFEVYKLNPWASETPSTNRRSDLITNFQVDASFEVWPSSDNLPSKVSDRERETFPIGWIDYNRLDPGDLDFAFAWHLDRHLLKRIGFILHKLDCPEILFDLLEKIPAAPRILRDPDLLEDLKYV